MASVAPRVLAHRGGADGLHPENSLPAFLEGVAAGADVLELDVRLTRDGQIAVIHDPELGRVSSSAQLVEQLSAEELRRIDLIDPSGASHPGIRVPLLPEILEACPDIRINIDIKANAPRLVDALVRLLQQTGAEQRVTVGSFLPAALERFRTQAPHVETSTHPGEVKQLLLGALAGRKPDTPARRVQVPVRHGIIPIVRPGFIQYLHRYGMAIDVWTINEPDQARRLASLGVDGIVTDRVRVIRSALGDNHEHS